MAPPTHKPMARHARHRCTEPLYEKQIKWLLWIHCVWFCPKKLVQSHEPQTNQNLSTLYSHNGSMRLGHSEPCYKCENLVVDEVSQRVTRWDTVGERTPTHHGPTSANSVPNDQSSSLLKNSIPKIFNNLTTPTSSQ